MASISRFGPYLTCNCGKSIKDPGISDELDVRYMVCTHIWDATKEGRDVKMFGPLEGDVVIPMRHVLTEGLPFNVRVTVRLHESKHGMAPVVMAGAPVSLGYIDATEGRWAIRYEVLEVLRANYFTLDLQCYYSKHTSYIFSATERSRKDLDSKSWPVLAAVYSMMMEGRCWRCVAMSTSYEDLAPEL